MIFVFKEAESQKSLPKEPGDAHELVELRSSGHSYQGEALCEGINILDASLF